MFNAVDPEGLSNFSNLLGKKDPGASANLVDPYIKVNFAGKEVCSFSTCAP